MRIRSDFGFARAILLIHGCVILSLAQARAMAEENRVTVTKVTGAGGTTLVARNNLRSPVTVTVDLSTRTNISASRDVPATFVVKPFTAAEVGTFGRDVRGKAWRFNYVYHWKWGSKDAKHPADQVYELPYARGSAYEVGQSFNGSFSHRNRHAVDWRMPVGTKVCAARGGTVVEIANNHAKGGNDAALRGKDNRVRILHSDGTIGLYCHFKRGGVVVKPGQKVSIGQLIGYSGDTGYSTEPHLHFEVTYPLDGYVSRTVWTRFNTAGGIVFMKAGEKFRRP